MNMFQVTCFINYKYEFPPLEDYRDLNRIMHTFKVQNPTTIELDNSKKEILQTEFVLN